jgi:hypothetical protein
VGEGKIEGVRARGTLRLLEIPSLAVSLFPMEKVIAENVILEL